jgi:hypothetical protein
MKGLTALAPSGGAIRQPVIYLSAIFHVAIHYLAKCCVAICFLAVCCLTATAAASDPLHAWTETYDGGGAYLDDVTAALTDADGHLIIAGESFDGVGGSDMLIRKLDRLDHGEIWQQRVPSFDTNDMAVSEMVCDPEGNVLVAGYIRGCEG